MKENVAALIGGWLVLYLLIAFVAMSMDPMQWGLGGRFFFAIMFIIWAYIVLKDDDDDTPDCPSNRPDDISVYDMP